MSNPRSNVLTRAALRSSLAPRVLLAAAGAGVASGLVCVALRYCLRGLQWLMTGQGGLLAEAASNLPLGRRFLTPVAGAALATLLLYFARSVRKVGKSVEYIQAVRFAFGRIPFAPTFWQTIASGLSISSGATIGREGSMIQFAGATVSKLGQLRSKPRIALYRLVAFGTAGAVAAVYQAPIAGAFFAFEIALGANLFASAALTELPALLMASIGGAAMSHYLLGSGPLFAVTAPVHLGLSDYPVALLCAIAIGTLGPLYTKSVRSGRFLRKLPLPLLWSGVVVGLLSCLQPETWGNGDSGVLDVLSGRLVWQGALVLLLLRMLSATACVGSGVVGGVFTPTIFAGSTLGLVFGAAVHFVNPHASAISYAVIGIACLLAAVTHAPLMAAFMTVELTGTPHFLLAVLLSSLLASQVASRISDESLYEVATTEPANKLRPPETHPVSDLTGARSI